MVRPCATDPSATHILLVRHLPAQNNPYPLPRPIILDTELRLLTSCKLVNNYQQNRGRRPWVVCSDVFTPDKVCRKRRLEDAGARVIEVTLGPDGVSHNLTRRHLTRHQGLSVDSLLTTLNNLGIKSLMVEGGQRVISSFLSHVDAEANHIVDVLILTIAPTFVGAPGMGALSQGSISVRGHRTL